MFGKDSKKQPEADKAPTSFSNPVSSVVPKGPAAGSKSTKSASTTLIARETEIFGDIKFSGNLEIEGTVVGNLVANPSSEASVRVQEGGRVEGDIRVPRVVINGEVKGTVHSDTLELAGNARIDGNVHYSTVEMMKGAQVNGSLVYSENALAQNNAGGNQNSSGSGNQGGKQNNNQGNNNNKGK
ncbi:Uncharacterised protein [BD1-7 clade bacterium]|uniref:Polymer-forming cytoskeletal n=1 Tax=BD1-7 clade bacterium TaxID=2029982 RepID=A0A5S9Q9U4_9GAMM|nr:Uncharacterised protein [BD1-7 clade bacterium]